MKRTIDYRGLAALVCVIIVMAAVFMWHRANSEPQTQIAGMEKRRKEPSAKSIIGLPAATSMIYSLLDPVSPIDSSQLARRIDRLPDSLTEPESMVICFALREGLPGCKSLEPSRRHHIGNQWMDALVRQKAAGIWLAAELANVWLSEKAEETLRDYALQHLAQLMEGRGPKSPHLSVWRNEGLPVLMAASRATNKRSAGTALLALHYLSRATDVKKPLLTLEDFDTLLYGIATNEGAEPSARAAAFQIAADRESIRLLASARELASNATTRSGLRLACIYYLGHCGTTAEDQRLSVIESENDPRYATASRAARARLSSKRP